MNKTTTHPSQARASRSLDYLRKRSQHRTWWSSARIALLRGRELNQATINARKPL